IYARNGMNNTRAGANNQSFNGLFNQRMNTVLQQIAQFADPNSLPILGQTLDDAAKALKIQQFAQVTDAQMDAKNIEADFQAGMKYLNMA
ncbi:MAG: hypothetical protein LW817_00610, partial [Candidatus Caenarcaniphilales bacterium]|nr:hypothetical protein [Candidatus Caenarcaniphilales bacterium]